ncbi:MULTISPECIES: alpha/beta fold hydrolase [Kitasatospora]|uniref:Alpha/beta fold hydrolase n=1 Tax=Kitasatospora cystarginea TaxID=58350 RepID=A0A1W6R564_9ACTN|nr:methylesterase [Kitasatospora cystarginea]
MAELLLEDGQSIHYQETGKGSPVLLVHGLGAPSAFLAATAEGLARDHRVVTFDLRGHGRTPLGTGPVGIDRCAADLHAVAGKLDLRAVTLVGWSLGATVAYRYLERYGAQRVARLVSVEQSPYLLYEDGWEHAAFGRLTAADAETVRQNLAGTDRAVAADQVAGYFAEGTVPDPDLLARLADAVATCSPAARQQLWQDVVRQDWRERLAALPVPVLFVHGARSRIYPSAVGSRLADTVPGARLEVFENSGHLPFLEEPERFQRTIRSWVAR